MKNRCRHLWSQVYLLKSHLINNESKLIYVCVEEFHLSSISATWKIAFPALAIAVKTPTWSLEQPQPLQEVQKPVSVEGLLYAWRC